MVDLRLMGLEAGALLPIAAAVGAIYCLYRAMGREEPPENSSEAPEGKELERPASSDTQKLVPGNEPSIELLVSLLKESAGSAPEDHHGIHAQRLAQYLAAAQYCSERCLTAALSGAIPPLVSLLQRGSASGRQHAARALCNMAAGSKVRSCMRIWRARESLAGEQGRAGALRRAAPCVATISRLHASTAARNVAL